MTPAFRQFRSRKPVMIAAIVLLSVMMACGTLTEVGPMTHSSLITSPQASATAHENRARAATSPGSRGSNTQSPAAGTSPYPVIAVGEVPYGFSYDPARNEIFVANWNSWNVSVISDVTDKVVATIAPPGEDLPRGMVYDPSKGETYVGAEYNGNVYVVNDTNDAVGAIIGVGGDPIGMAYDSATGQIFVPNWSDGNVSIINDTTNTVVETVELPGGGQAFPYGAAYDPSKGEVFVTDNGFTNDTDLVSVISDSSDQVVANIPVGTNPRGIAYDPAQGWLYVANAGSNNVSVISDATNTVIATIPVGPFPQSVTYTPGGEVLITNSGGGSTEDGTVSEISVGSNTVIQNLTVQVGPDMSGYDSGTNQLFIENGGNGALGAGGNNVSIIDLGFSVTASASATHGTAPLTVNFTTSVQGGSGGYSYAWAFGDGGSSSSQNPSYTYSTAGNYSAQVTVTDGHGSQAVSQPILITVQPTPPITVNLTTSRVALDVGQQTNVSATAQGGSGPLSYQFSASSAAAGCLATGTTMACRPTLGGFDFTVTVQVSDGAGATRSTTSSTIFVSPALAASLAVSDATPSLGQSIEFTVTVGGGDGGYSYAYTGLPPGCVTLDSATVGCLPTEAGSYNATVQVEDQNGEVVTSVVPLQVIFDFSVVAPATDTVGTALTIQVSVGAAGTPVSQYGTLTYLYSGLPTGCMSQDTATLTCTPTVAGTFVVDVSVHNAAGLGNSHDVTIQVVSGPSSPGFLGLPGNEGYLLLLVVLVVVVAAVGAAYRASKSRSVPPEDSRQADPFAGYRQPPPKDANGRPKVLEPGQVDPVEDIF